MADAKHTPGPNAVAAMAFVRRYANSRRGHGGYPTSNERYAVHMVLEEHAAMLAALTEAYAEIRRLNADAGETIFNPAATDLVRAAIAKTEGRQPQALSDLAKLDGETL